MCDVIVINLGEKEIDSPKAFLDHFGVMPTKEPSYDELNMDCCLCQIDVEASLNAIEVEFRVVDGYQYNVGMLDKF